MHEMPCDRDPCPLRIWLPGYWRRQSYCDPRLPLRIERHGAALMIMSGRFNAAAGAQGEIFMPDIDLARYVVCQLERERREGGNAVVR